MAEAILASFRSKDPKSQNGACVVGRDRRTLGVGYNGLPEGCRDDDGFWNDNDDANIYHSKHTYVVHAERNAVYNCTLRPGGAAIYTTLFPCPICAQTLVQNGIKKVVYLDVRDYGQHVERNRASWRIFTRAGVETLRYRPETAEDAHFIRELRALAAIYGGNPMRTETAMLSAPIGRTRVNWCLVAMVTVGLVAVAVAAVASGALIVGIAFL